MRRRMAALPQRRSSLRPYANKSAKKAPVSARCTTSEQNEYLHAMHLHSPLCMAVSDCCQG